MDRSVSAFHSLYGCGISSFNSSPAGGTCIGNVNHLSNVQNSSLAVESRQSASAVTSSAAASVAAAAAMLFQPTTTVTSSSQQGRTLSLQHHQQLLHSDSAAGYRLNQLGLLSSSAGNEQLARLEREMLGAEYKNATSAIDFQPPYFPPPCNPSTAPASSGMTMTSTGQFHLMGYPYGSGSGNVSGGGGHAYGHHSNVPHQYHHHHQGIVSQHPMMAPPAPSLMNDYLSYWTPLIGSSYSMNETSPYGETSSPGGKEQMTYHTLQEVCILRFTRGFKHTSCFILFYFY